MKHPGPWRLLECDVATDDPLNIVSGYLPGEGDVVDALGAMVVFGGGYECADPSAFADDEAERLILAAPELLAALKEATAFTDHFGPPEWSEHVHALIDSVEKG